MSPKVAPSRGVLDQRVGNAKPIEIPLWLTHAGSRKEHWRHRISTTEPSAVSAKGNSMNIMQQRLSLYLLLTHLSVALNFPHKNPTAMRPFVKIFDHLSLFTRISCRWQTCATRYIMANVLQTNIKWTLSVINWP